MKFVFCFSLLLALSNIASGHIASFAKGMYCFGGPDPNYDDPNTNTAVNPLYFLRQSQWWFQNERGCDRVPPAAGEFLELPAGGRFTVQQATNRAFTTFSHNGQKVTDWPDGGQHPEDWNGNGNGAEGCINNSGAMHTQNQSMAAGTAFAISYNSEISQVNMNNLVVFTVLPNTPWKRIATYDVPRDLPPCPANGCICAWGWVPKGCGERNMYMQGFRCKVTGSTSTRRLATAQVPRHCADNSNDCVRGAKQMLIQAQAEGNNSEKPANGWVAYDAKWGFSPGAQNDIFV